MAEIIPLYTDSQIDGFKSKAEAKLYQAFRDKLGSKYLVLHSTCWIGHLKSGIASDGEVDFVVCDPGKGILAIEVKGGGIRVEPATSRWFSIDLKGEEHDIKNPFEQAKNAKYALLKEYRKHKSCDPGKTEPLCCHAVFFPDVSTKSGFVSPDKPSDIIGVKSDIDNIQKWLDGVFSFWQGNNQNIESPGAISIKIVKDIFCKRIEVRSLISFYIEEEEKRRIQLTQQQSIILSILGTRKRAAICGGAGTGKTLIALQKAKMLAASGKKTLLLCYNQLLAEHLNHSTNTFPYLQIMNFHQFCIWAANQCGGNIMQKAQNAYPSGDKYDVQMPYALCLAAETLRLSFDAIVVDEAQDFSEDYWIALEMFLKDANESILYIFYDPNQAIYKKDFYLPIKEDPFPLTINCRNTKNIHEMAYQYFEGHPTTPPEIDGKPIIKIVAPTAQVQFNKLNSVITDLISKEKMKASDISILIAGKPKTSYYKYLNDMKLPRGNECRVEDHHKDGTILVDTVKRFKGLEAQIVFLWGLDTVDSNEWSEILYIGISRAKSMLYIVATEQICEKIYKNNDS